MHSYIVVHGQGGHDGNGHLNNSDFELLSFQIAILKVQQSTVRYCIKGAIEFKNVKVEAVCWSFKSSRFSYSVIFCSISTAALQNLNKV